MINFKGQTIKGFWWIPRHSETMKGVVTDEMLREAGHKLSRRSPNRATFCTTCWIHRQERDNPVNWNISVAGGEESNRDSLSSGERKGNSLNLNKLLSYLGVVGRYSLTVVPSNFWLHLELCSSHFGLEESREQSKIASPTRFFFEKAIWGNLRRESKLFAWVTWLPFTEQDFIDSVRFANPKSCFATSARYKTYGKRIYNCTVRRSSWILHHRW